ncbi:DUF1816 domain-containing protein [Aliterella atlantica]|uniref:DUF1816 domain-containing protein n=1 Tax=Aliterella atlantica TaxID=1827278 RepID=UPI0005D31214|nr:DUF1816 domain-containing protein [Aliterella atlantica]
MIKRLIVGFMQKLNAPWWAEITTVKPSCVYYFGPFDTSAEAKEAYPGYVEDLDGEGAQGIVVVIKRCNPEVLTKCEE